MGLASEATGRKRVTWTKSYDTKTTSGYRKDYEKADNMKNVLPLNSVL
jgi:hypothetical protein